MNWAVGSVHIAENPISASNPDSTCLSSGRGSLLTTSKGFLNGLWLVPTRTKVPWKTLCIIQLLGSLASCTMGGVSRKSHEKEASKQTQDWLVVSFAFVFVKLCFNPLLGLFFSTAVTAWYVVELVLPRDPEFIVWSPAACRNIKNAQSQCGPLPVAY